MNDNRGVVVEIVELCNQTLRRGDLIEGAVLVLLNNPDQDYDPDLLHRMLDYVSEIRTEQLSIKALF